MKKFALLALVLTFGGLMVAGCPQGNNTGNKATTNTNTNAPADTNTNAAPMENNTAPADNG